MVPVWWHTMTTSSLQAEQALTKQRYRHMVMIVSGLLFAGSALGALITENWRNLMIGLILVVLVFAPVVAERWIKVTVPTSVQVQYAALLVAGPYLGGYWRWYEIWQPWDTVVHFYSGIIASFALLLLLNKTVHTYRLSLPPWFEIVMLITAKATIALTWEIGEFFFDLTFDTRTQGGNFDTMTDMMAGVFPALVIAVGLYLHQRYGMFRYFTSLDIAGKTPGK